jgi:hypothetical protein
LWNAFLLKNINIPTPVEIAISATLKMALKSKIVAAPNRQPVRTSFQNGNKTYQLLYRENRRHKAVLKTM